MYFAAGRQAREIGDLSKPAADLGVKGRGLLVRQRQELVEITELAHDFERRGVDGVAAEVAQKVFVFFDYGDGDACAGQ